MNNVNSTKLVLFINYLSCDMVKKKYFVGHKKVVTKTYETFEYLGCDWDEDVSKAKTWNSKEEAIDFFEKITPGWLEILQFFDRFEEISIS